MPISTTLRKLLCHARQEQEEDEPEAPARRPLPEPVEAGPAQAGRPYQAYVENEEDRMLREISVYFRRQPHPEKIPLPEHPDPQHRPVYYTIDRDTGRPIPGRFALIRGDYVYVPEDGSRITRGEYIHQWYGPGVIPTANGLLSQRRDACYTLHGEGAGMRLAYHWLSGYPSEPRINMRMDRFFSPGFSPIHFSPRSPVRAEASATRPVPEPVRQPAGRTGYPPVRAEASATRPVPEPARQPAGRAGLRRIEIPLPDHQAPKHPRIYYTLDPVSGRPIPERDSFIFWPYVRRQDLNPVYLTNIVPWRPEQWQ